MGLRVVPQHLLASAVCILLYALGNAHDQSSDEQALLQFAFAVGNGNMLGWWSVNSSMCLWTGVECSQQAGGSRVFFLSLPSRGLYGPIPTGTLEKLDALMMLSLQSNNLSGPLPYDLLALESLRFVYLQNNNFSGNIPSLLPTHLDTLDLSFNSLTGPIPNLTFTSLKSLNLSYNNLSGSIPHTLRKLPASSFVGNPMLCGRPLNLCPSDTPLPQNLWKSKLVSGLIGSAVVVLIILVVGVGYYLKRHGIPYIGRGKLFFFPNSELHFKIEDIFSSGGENEYIKGSFHKLKLPGNVFVMLKFLGEITAGKRKFEQLMDDLWKLGVHDNLLRVQGYYYHPKRTVLFFEYVVAGTFDQLLYGTESQQPADWGTKMEIVIGAAIGIAHMHSNGKAHGNIRPTNIVLTSDSQHRVQGSISDYCMYAVSKQPAQVVDYQAPELISTGVHTREADVYSFGVVLYEMMSGEEPVSKRLNQAVIGGLVQKYWTEIDNQFVEFNLVEGMEENEKTEEMRSLIQSCVQKEPEKRPTMGEVLARLVRLK